MRLFVGFFAVMMLVAAPVQAVDGAGKHTTLGARSCGQWLEAAKEDGLLRVVLKSWVSGYVTAVNTWIEGKNDWLEGIDIPSAMLWIDKYCKENPLSNGSDAMWYLLRELGVKR